MKQILSALAKAKNISAWKINATTTESCELFYVQKKVETIRATDTTDYSLTVYVDQDGKRGQSGFTVYPYMEEEEILALIDENAAIAALTLNDPFDLPHPQGKSHPEVQSNLAAEPFRNIIGKIGAAIMKANEVENASLSATEIFLYRVNNRVINSNGVDESSTSYRCRIETIPNYVKGEEEVELYQAISFGSFDPETLTKKVADAIKLCKDRAFAIKMPKIDELPVILQDEETAQFFASFVEDLDYGTAYHHYNMFNLGDDIQEGRTGDTLDIELRPFVEGALSSTYVDVDGVVLQPVHIIQDGKVVARHGNYRYGIYMKEENPTGMVPVACVKEGSSSMADFAKKPYLRCVRFSDMQVDPFSGFVGGEVRLAYYFDGEKEIPVTGLTIQGDYKKLKSSFLASRETIVLDEYAGPKYVYFPSVKIV